MGLITRARNRICWHLKFIQPDNDKDNRAATEIEPFKNRYASPLRFIALLCRANPNHHPAEARSIANRNSRSVHLRYLHWPDHIRGHVATETRIPNS